MSSSGVTAATEHATAVVSCPFGPPSRPLPQEETSYRSIQKSPTRTTSSVEPPTAFLQRVKPAMVASLVQPNGQLGSVQTTVPSELMAAIALPAGQLPVIRAWPFSAASPP